MNLALALLLAAAPATPAHEVQGAPAWLQVATPASPGVQTLWETLQWRRANRRADGSLPSEGGVAPDLHYHPTRARFTERDGPYPGEWLFLAAPDAERPNAAYRLRAAEGSQYGMHADLLCDDEPACGQAHAVLAQLRAPAPEAPEHFEDWLRIVSTEACTPGPKEMPAPDYPSRAIREQTRGVVVLDLWVNRCGEVRWLQVQESSGSREIDRAAARSARGWRTPPPDGAAFARLRVPIRFDLADYDAAPPAN